MKTYAKYDIALLDKRQVSVDAYRVTSSKYVLRFFTKTGVVEFPWDMLLGFFEDDGKPRRKMTEQEMIDAIFNSKGPPPWTARNVFGRKRFKSLVPPYRLIGEGRMDFPDEMRDALKAARERVEPDPNQLNLPLNA